jgi:hypothetical protein
MGIFLPHDISDRIARFIASKTDFPFINRDEIIAAFYLFGKEFRVVGEPEVKASTDLARGAVEQVARDVRLYNSMPQRLDARFSRENYTKRSLQIVVESASDSDAEMSKRVAGDPTILSDCFAQHVAYYKHDYFFELFQPFQSDQLPRSLQSKLEGRMLLLGYSVKGRQSLPFKSPLEPFFGWMSKV